MSFVVRRFSFYFIAIMVAITFNFVIPRMMPGDPVDALFAAAQGRMPLETLQAYKEMLGFVDGPLWVQYLKYIKSIFTWDLGPTIMLYPLPVTELLAVKVPWTIGLAGMSTVISVMIGLLIGTYASYHRGGFTDRFMPGFWAFVGAMPQPVTALFVFFILALSWKWFPLSYGADPDLDSGWTWEYIASVLHHAVLPITCMILGGIGAWIFNMRNAMINVLGEDYITMAKAKGLSSRRIMTHYAARNALLPVVTAVSMQIGFVMAGAIFIETVFNYPGVGLLLFKALGARDYPTMQACFLLIVVFVLVFNFIADLLYLWLDPRLRS
ncbi:MAG: ABC transporter permease [Gammaproteobacteria bacterium]|jgi:peptide/nickel transport system permease protein|nr:ABC transporter permease [Gammaproteobacteria bacterium]